MLALGYERFLRYEKLAQFNARIHLLGSDTFRKKNGTPGNMKSIMVHIIELTYNHIDYIFPYGLILENGTHIIIVHIELTS